MKEALAVLATLFLATAAFGQSGPLMTTKDLQTACTTGMKVFNAQGEASPNDAEEYGKCISYIEGVLDSMRFLVEIDQHGKAYKFHLHGDGLTLKDAIACFLTFTREDKEYDQNGLAAPTLIRSLLAKHILTKSPMTPQ